ncbi:MAG: hypothetical protein ABIQ16_27450, partial [Polyangiaceae bacterium]
MNNERKSSHDLRTVAFRSGWRLAGICILGAVSCGVSEHQHQQQSYDSSNDFGPLGTAGAVTSLGGAATSLGGAGTSLGGAGTSLGGAGTSLGGASNPGGAGNPSNGGTATGGAPAAAAGAPSGTAGAASGVTIALGGVNVPIDHAIAFIHIGHSNMAGRATSPTASRPYHFEQTDPHAYMYHVGKSPELAIEPKTAGDTAAAGPGTSLVKEAVALAPNYYFIS